MPKELVRARACGGWTRAHTSMISAFAWLGQWQIARWARVTVPVAHSLWPALGACARVVYRCWGGSDTDRRRARERPWMTYPCVSLNTQAKPKGALTAHDLKKRTAGP